MAAWLPGFSPGVRVPQLGWIGFGQASMEMRTWYPICFHSWEIWHWSPGLLHFYHFTIGKPIFYADKELCHKILQKAVLTDIHSTWRWHHIFWLPSPVHIDLGRLSDLHCFSYNKLQWSKGGGALRPLSSHVTLNKLLFCISVHSSVMMNRCYDLFQLLCC
jgi:hypothetical protein